MDNFSFDVFLSHSSKDLSVILEVAKQLKKDGLKVWLDYWEIQPGDNIQSKIDDALARSRILVLCMSVNAAGSDWTRLEAGTVLFSDPLNKERRLVPLRLDAAPIKGVLAQFDSVNWYSADRKQQYAKLLAACRPRTKAATAKTDNTGQKIPRTAVLDKEHNTRDWKTFGPRILGLLHNSHARTGILLCLCLSTVAYFISVGSHVVKPSPNPTSHGSLVTILVADFVGGDSPRDLVLEHIVEGLRSSTKEYPYISIRRLEESITPAQGATVARARAEREHANLILWGSYLKTSKSVEVTANFEVVPLPGSDSSGATLGCGPTSLHHPLPIYPVEELDSFTLHLKAAAEVRALAEVAIGVALYRTGNYLPSVDHFSRVINLTPKPESMIKSEQIYLLRATAYLALGEIERAISDLTSAINLEPTNIIAIGNRGYAYLKSKHLAKALQDYSEAIRLGSGSCLACAYVYRGSIYVNMEQYSDAVSDFTHAIQLNPRSAAAYDGRGHTHLHQGNFPAASEDLQKAIEISPARPCSFKTLGEMYVRQRKPELAIASYSKAIELEPKHAGFYNERAKAYLEDGDTERALADVAKAMELDPSMLEACRTLGLVYATRRDRKEAVLEIDRAIELNGKLGYLYILRGDLHKLDKDVAKAKQDYTRVLDVAADEPTRNEAFERLRTLDEGHQGNSGSFPH